jgi:hypothetical protein
MLLAALGIGGSRPAGDLGGASQLISSATPSKDDSAGTRDEDGRIAGV